MGVGVLRTYKDLLGYFGFVKKFGIVILRGKYEYESVWWMAAGTAVDLEPYICDIYSREIYDFLKSQKFEPQQKFLIIGYRVH